MRKAFKVGGLVAGSVLIAFGVVAIIMGVNGRSTVNSSIRQEQIVGTADMTPAAITAEATKAKLDVGRLSIPTCTIADKPVTDGAGARCFAEYMRIHTFEATGGFTYSQMGMYVAAAAAPKAEIMAGGGTDNGKYAQLDPATKLPVANGARNVWVTYTALTTALNSSYLASQLALFGVVVGVALLLSGFGFVILAIGGALRSAETSSAPVGRAPSPTSILPAPSV